MYEKQEMENAMLKIVKCKCDSQKSPLGIDNPRPDFSWQMQSEERNVMQIGYRILVIKKETEEVTVWDSGWVDSDAGIAVAY